MEWNEMEVGSHVAKFCQHVKADKSEYVLGGILRRGSWAWLAEDCTLQIISLKSGQAISSYTFHRSVYNCNIIVCVTEVFPNNNLHDVLLAVCLDYMPSNVEATVANSCIALYSVEHGCVLSCIRLDSYVTCMRFLAPKNCRRSLTQHFDGCLAVGTQQGDILVVDLYLNYLLNLYGEKQTQYLNTPVTPINCHIVDYNIPLVEIHRTYKKILRERSLQNVVHFGVQIEVIESPCSVETLLPVDLISGLAAGLEDGRLVIYDMSELQIFYVSEEHELSPLIKMDFLEPSDDPRACFYILTIHGNEKKVVQCLFSFMYEKRVRDECGNIYFENFQYGAMKLEMLLESNTNMAITCQAITKPPKNGDDDATCLFAISWNSMQNEETKLLVFDINQWYKEEMPRTLSGDQARSCLATFILKNRKYGLDAFLNPATISHFNSMQRCEEHFYPNSLSFDWLLLDANTGCTYNWPGAQNKILNILRASSAALFLEPDVIFEKIRQARLLPQFTELNVNALFSQSAKYEVILSVALEHNCMGLLHDCARSWADGSFTGNNNILPSRNVELNLQTLKNWIWKRASNIKMRCNELCEGLLSHSGHPLDQREKKELGFITRQLRSLADLYDEVMQQYSKQNTEKAKDGSLHLAADYQELLIWLINIGLLPETSQRFQNEDMPTTSSLSLKMVSVYPYKQLREYYVQRRSAFAKIDECYISKKSGSCRLIFIDAFIEHECMRHNSIAGARNNDNLREYWLQNEGNGLYPPGNIESMLRVMLLSNVSYESKCAILFYFFLDLHVALTDGDRHDGEDLKEIVENFLKFPSVFKLSPSLTKTLQAFWHLDHGNIVAAVDEFLSPFNNNRKVEQWLIELLVESLLLQNAAHLALRILDAHSSLIAPCIKLSTLLANNLIAEAFHFVRSKDDDELMKRFFTNCLRMGKLGVIRDLALNEHEGKLVENLLKRIQLPGAENLHFVYLLQKSKYIEAVSYMDELSKGKSMRYGNSIDTSAMDAPNLVISAFNTTMAPVTQTLTDVYFRIRDKIKQKETQNRSPVPLSCQLIKQNANNLLGGIYHSSALSAHFATSYYDEELQYGRQNNTYAHPTVVSPLSANNAPFLRKPQTETCRETMDLLDRQTISYPQEYKLSDKRRVEELQNEDAVDAIGTENVQHQKLQQPTKRRRLLGEDFLTGFKHFQQKNIVLNETGLNLTNEISESFITKPLTTNQSSQKDRTNEYTNHANGNPPVKTLASNELHGILKSNTPEPSELRLRRGDTPANEEKTLRFTLPETEYQIAKTTVEAISQEETAVDIEPEVKHRVITRSISEESKESITDDVEMKAPTVAEEICEPVVKHSVVTRSVSEESVTDDVEMTQYQSALSTQNQSLSKTPVSSASIKDSGVSFTTKPLESRESTVSLYQSARCKSLSPNAVGPKPRKPLLRMSAEPEERPENQMAVKNVSYAKEISSGLGTSLNKDTDSGEASTSKHQRASLLKISSIKTISSIEFTPLICSSKVGETQPKILDEQLKLSERSTIVMTSAAVCEMDSNPSQTSKSNSHFIQPRPPLTSTEENKNDSIEKPAIPSLDTTLGMSSYEATDFEATTVETANEEIASYDLQLLETTTKDLDKDRTFEEDNDHDAESTEQSSEVIELGSSTDENDVDESENESAMEYETDEQTDDSVYEVESNDASESVANTDSNQDTSNSNEMDHAIEVDDGGESVISDSNDIILQQEDSDVSENDDDSTHEGVTNEKTHSKNTKTENTEIEPATAIEIGIQPRNEKEIQNVPIICTPAEQNVVEEKVVELLGGSSEPQAVETATEQTEEHTETFELITTGVSDKSVAVETNLNVEEPNVDSLLEKGDKQLKDKSVVDACSSDASSKIFQPLSKESETNTLKWIDITSKEPINNQLEIKIIRNEDSAAKDGLNKTKLPTVENNESGNKAEEENAFEKTPTAEAVQETKEPEHEGDQKDIDTSDRFETPNTSLHSIKGIEKDTLKTAMTTEADSPIAEQYKLQSNESFSSTPQMFKRRGQSLPPQPLLIVEENLEADSQTPRRRSKRGISVPPQTIESVPLTPTARKKRKSNQNLLSSGSHKAAHEKDDSPQSPSSSRSGRESQQKRQSLGGSGGPLPFDSPALRTRSRMRTISENSDNTANSMNSPSISGKKPRRPSLSSSISEQLQHALTPKRTRRRSISGQSDTEGTPQSRRILLKEVDEEEEKSEVQTTETVMDTYSSTRRLTRTQRALLEKSQHISIILDNPKDDQASVSSRISQTSSRSKRPPSRSASIKSNDDGADDDRASVTSSVASELRRSSRRLRLQQQPSPNTNLTSIPEDDVVESKEPPSKRNKSGKK